MLKRLMIVLLLILPLGAAASQCGFKPFTPIGCKPDPICLCDEDGRNCRWVYQC